jgi:mannose-6-phosphate isomerase
MILYPLTFQPIFQERIWGGRKLESLYGKSLPPGKVIGESWEISDRPEANSIIANGPLKGKSLHDLMMTQRKEIMGLARAPEGRFPLLIKLLDAQDNLSLQVHPPQHLAASMGGQPKTEMWYVSAAEPGALLYAGLRQGVTSEEFARKTRTGEVAECFHQLPVKAGNSLFLPSGRVHALGKGLVIFEIQQNSDTTYRVFDWNRVDASGKPRQLHVEESLKCIDFEDFEPVLTPDRVGNVEEGIGGRPLARHALFEVDQFLFKAGSRLTQQINEPNVIGVIKGTIEIPHPSEPVTLNSGQFALIPAGLKEYTLIAKTDVTALVASPG